MFVRSHWLRTVAVLTSCAILHSFASAADRPNVVLIMSDNHGAWTLGCYGNRDIRTPHLDHLAEQGTLFTRAFASNPVCSPTRATFLTGLMPSQHGVHCFLTGNRLQIGPDARCTLDQVSSLPEILQEAGYACGLVGKWHLGDNVHPQEGFDDYWITMPHGGTSTFYDATIIENGRLRKEPAYLTDFWTEHAVRFIDDQAKSDKPFFLFLAYNGPYALSRLLLRQGQNRHAAYYADKELLSFPRQSTHPWQFSNRDYHNNPVAIRRVATEVSGLDDGVGRIMETLERNEIDDQTVVVFVADQGWVGGQGGFFGMGDHTRPVTARDGMMRIPMIWRHPDRIGANVKSDRMVTNYDFMPTLLSHLNLADRMPKHPPSPGVDFGEALTGDRHSGDRSDPSDHAVFYEFEGLRCVRTENWKYVHRHPNGPHELFDLRSDPDEFNNLAGDDRYQDQRRLFKQRIDAFFERYSETQYDLWNGGGSQTKLFVGIDEELAQRDSAQLPHAGRQPTTEFRPATFKLPEGFTAELVAAAPLVTHPTLGCLDDQGRLFICNNAGVNLSAEELEQQLPNSIRMLEDVDGDGRYDRSTVFADKMTYPMGGVWHDGALYVASPPNIWRLQDTDGDGVADVRDPIVSRFGYTGNAASIHGCFFGPDGRLYWCDGYHGHEIEDDKGHVTSRREGSYLFSCRTDGSDVRIHCGGGMDNPVEVDFTDEGELVGTVNILYSRPRVDALVHWLHGGAYPHRESVLQEIKTTGALLGPLQRFGHVAVSGTTRYRSGVIDHRWRDNFFATFFNSGKVVRVELGREGSTFHATQREFLSATSDDFHPTDVIEDADGSLLVVDTGGWFYRGCPTSQMSKPDVLGGIYRIRRSGMTTQVDPWGSRIDWKALTDAEVIKQLNDTRHPVRRLAIAECARRADSIVPELGRAVRGDLRVRRNAIWALTRIIGDGPSDDAHAAIRETLHDREPSIRQTACRSIATYPDSTALNELISIAGDDPFPQVRREAVKAIGRIGDPDAVAALLTLIADAESADRSEEHALTYALIEINHPDRTRRGLDHPSTRVRRSCLIALDQMENGRLSNLEIARQLESDDAGLRDAAVAILSRVPNFLGEPFTGELTRTIQRIANRLQDRLADSDRDSSAAILPLAGALASAEPVATVIGRFLRAHHTPDQRVVMLDAIAQGDRVPLHDTWKAPLEECLRSADPGLILNAIRATGSLDSDHFDKILKQISADNTQPGTVRVAALKVLSSGDSRWSDGVFDTLLQLLDEGLPTESGQAAQLIAASRLTEFQLVELTKRLPDAGPTVLRDLVRPFGGRLNAAVADSFLDGLSNARSFDRLDVTTVSDSIKRLPAHLLPRANALLDRLKFIDQERIEKLDRLLPMVVDADAEHGEAVFFGAKAKCASCHRVGDRGTAVGPDLTTIGANRSIQDLLESIVFPSASIVRQYESSTLLTRSGQVYAGIITRQTADELSLQQPAGDPIAIKLADIEDHSPSTVSIMPTGIDAAISEQELAALAAWLKNQTGR